MRVALAAFGLAAMMTSPLAQEVRQGLMLGDLTWQQAEKVLTPDSVVVIPLGGGAVQNGPHMKLDSADRLARYLAQRVRAGADVVVAPPLTYHFYPAFLEYPGSTSLSLNTARDMTAEIVRTLAKHGPRRFYVLNTGTTTMFSLKEAAEMLADDGILLGYLDPQYRLAEVPRQQARVTGGPHADEIETSMMLFADSSAVEMTRAVREYGRGSGAMTRLKDSPGVFSASGVAGDATLATHQKGQRYIDAIVSGALEDIAAIRSAPLPIAKTKAAPPAPAPAAPRPRPSRPSEPQQPNGCLPSDERAIRAVGERFSYLWRQMDADKIAELFAASGDMRHPDGTIERGPDVIRDNRRELFNKREYRGSVHQVSLNDIRCLSGGTALADGRWELRLEDLPTSGAPARNLSPARRHSGWCTLVLTGGGGSWAIQAWRYTVNPPDGTAAPTTLKQPGFLGRGGH